MGKKDVGPGGWVSEGPQAESTARAKAGPAGTFLRRSESIENWTEMRRGSNGLCEAGEGLGLPPAGGWELYEEDKVSSSNQTPYRVRRGVFAYQLPASLNTSLPSSPHNGRRALSPVMDGWDFCSLASERPAVPSPCSHSSELACYGPVAWVGPQIPLSV